MDITLVTHGPPTTTRGRAPAAGGFGFPVPPNASAACPRRVRKKSGPGSAPLGGGANKWLRKGAGSKGEPAKPKFESGGALPRGATRWRPPRVAVYRKFRACAESASARMGAPRRTARHHEVQLVKNSLRRRRSLVTGKPAAREGQNGPCSMTDPIAGHADSSAQTPTRRTNDTVGMAVLEDQVAHRGDPSQQEGYNRELARRGRRGRQGHSWSC